MHREEDLRANAEVGIGIEPVEADVGSAVAGYWKRAELWKSSCFVMRYVPDLGWVIGW